MRNLVNRVIDFHVILKTCKNLPIYLRLSDTFSPLIASPFAFSLFIPDEAEGVVFTGRAG